MDLLARIQAFRGAGGDVGIKSSDQFSDNPFDVIKASIRRQMENEEEYRVSVLKRVQAMENLSADELKKAAMSMTEAFFQKGETIIRQDEVGDIFYVIEDGSVVVTRKNDVNDPKEAPSVLARLGKNAFFGEVALLTDEPRSATVTVTSDICKCLLMSKEKFDFIISTAMKLTAKSRRAIGKSVVDAVPLFKSLSPSEKEKIVETMVAIVFPIGSYIARQGAAGNSFFIITDGTCRVTQTTEDKKEKEIGRLTPGSYFGDASLVDSTAKRQANVVSLEKVTCLSLTRADYHKVLKAFRAANKHGRKGQNKPTMLKIPRKITSVDPSGAKSDQSGTLLRRLARFMTDSLWGSLYGCMYREMLLNDTIVPNYGPIALHIMDTCGDRDTAERQIAAETARILSKSSSARSGAEISFVMGIMNQRNVVKNNVCKHMQPAQFASFTSKVRFLRARPLGTIVEVGMTGTTAFLILKGCVRLWEGENSSKLSHLEDLGPGEAFCLSVFSGNRKREVSAMALTTVDMVVMDEDDFHSVQDTGASKLTVDAIDNFLRKLPLFRSWEDNALMKLCHALEQEEITKGTVLARKGSEAANLSIMLNGQAVVVRSLERMNVVATLQQGEFIGESCLLNSRQPFLPKVAEEFNVVASSRVEVLVLNSQHFHLFDSASTQLLRAGFVAKNLWRKGRSRDSRKERRRLRTITKLIFSDANKIDAIDEAAAMKSGDGDTESEHLPSLHSRQPLVMSTASSVAVGSTLTPSYVGDIEDIPVALDVGFDPLMVLPTCKNDKILDRRERSLADIRKPKEARVRARSASSRRDVGFTGRLTNLNQGNGTYRAQRYTLPAISGMTQHASVMEGTILDPSTASPLHGSSFFTGL